MLGFQSAIVKFWDLWRKGPRGEWGKDQTAISASFPRFLREEERGPELFMRGVLVHETLCRDLSSRFVESGSH